MSWVSWVCFGSCIAIIISVLRRGADPFSPARVFGFIWSLSIGLADLKFSAFQQVWNFYSWALLLIAVTAFLVGTFIAYVLNLHRKMLPIAYVRHLMKYETVHEKRLFWLIIVSSVIYISSYAANFLIKGWLPISASEMNISRVEFNVTGLSFLTYSVPAIIFFIVLYYLKVQGKKSKKVFLTIILLIVVGSFFLFVSRFQIIIIFVVCGTLLYYSTHYIRFRTGFTLFVSATAFFYWISSIRFSRFVAGFLYTTSKMKFPKEYAVFTEPYMYFVMNLENFARSVNLLDFHTYGYFTFDFITAMSGLKYWVVDYFNLERLPFIICGYNTYSAFWYFYFDFGIIGLAVFPGLLGIGSGLLYYRMRNKPTIKNVTAYGIMLFVNIFTFFVFPLSFLWFEFNLLLIYLVLRWTVISQEEHRRLSTVT